jgi:nucleoside-diphosphate-sugar epimerase
MARVLITGVAGFIGSNLADRLLADGHEVTGIDNFAYGLRAQVPEGVRLIDADIRDPKILGAFAGTDSVFHLAAKNCLSDCEDDPVETASVNVEGTVNVFEACRRAAVRNVIYAETSALYEGTQHFPSREDDVAPKSFYAISKFAGMAFARRYERHFGMRMTALRYFNVYGPRQDYRRTVPPVMSAFILALLKGERPVIYGTGEKRRDFIFVDDVNDFHATCLTDSRTAGRTFNLGSGKSYSVLDIYRKVSELLGKDIPPEHRPEIRGDEAEETLADISAAKELGWSPKVSLEEGLQRSIAFIREHVLGGG